MKNRLFLVLGLVIPILTVNCTNKKAAEKAETTEATEKTESVIKVSKPEFKKFVVVPVQANLQFACHKYKNL